MYPRGWEKGLLDKKKFSRKLIELCPEERKKKGEDLRKNYGLRAFKTGNAIGWPKNDDFSFQKKGWRRW